MYKMKIKYYRFILESGQYTWQEISKEFIKSVLERQTGNLEYYFNKLIEDEVLEYNKVLYKITKRRTNA